MLELFTLFTFLFLFQKKLRPLQRRLFSISNFRNFLTILLTQNQTAKNIQDSNFTYLEAINEIYRMQGHSFLGPGLIVLKHLRRIESEFKLAADAEALIHYRVTAILFAVMIGRICLIAYQTTHSGHWLQFQGLSIFLFIVICILSKKSYHVILTNTIKEDILKESELQEWYAQVFPVNNHSPQPQNQILHRIWKVQNAGLHTGRQNRDLQLELLELWSIQKCDQVRQLKDNISLSAPVIELICFIFFSSTLILLPFHKLLWTLLA